MHKPFLAAALPGLLAACAGTLENPADYLLYRDEPLVARVSLDMSKQRVLEIAGPPTRDTPRSVNPGTCQDYLLSKEGRQQAYHVSFDSAARVDGKGFSTCRQMEDNERARARPPIGIGGGGGY